MVVIRLAVYYGTASHADLSEESTGTLRRLETVLGEHVMMEGKQKFSIPDKKGNICPNQEILNVLDIKVNSNLGCYYCEGRERERC